jgi:DNA-binding transcriptional LysR family regulator
MASLKALSCLVALVDEKSVTRAAAKLGMSQPALSHQIAAIERELGTAAVERLPRGVRPTAAGMAAAEIARTALDAADRAIAAGRAAGLGQRGRVRIASTETISGWLLPPVLRRWRTERPDVDLELTEYRSADRMIDALDAGRVDLAICPRPTATRAHVEVLGREEMLVIAAADHPFSKRRAVRAADLAGQPVIHYDRENGLAAWLDEFAAQHRIVLETVLRTRSPRTAAQLAAAGMGVAIVPASSVIPRPDGTVRSLDPIYIRDVVVASTSNEDALIRRFLADLHQDAGVGSSTWELIAPSAR